LDYKPLRCVKVKREFLYHKFVFQEAFMKLVLCEKPSVAKSVSAVLKANMRKDGYFIGDSFIVSWCAGHLLELAAPNLYDERYSKSLFNISLKSSERKPK